MRWDGTNLKQHDLVFWERLKNSVLATLPVAACWMFAMPTDGHGNDDASRSLVVTLVRYRAVCCTPFRKAAICVNSSISKGQVDNMSERLSVIFLRQKSRAGLVRIRNKVSPSRRQEYQYRMYVVAK